MTDLPVQAPVDEAAWQPCRYHRAAYPILGAEACWGHRDEQRVYDLAVAMARIFQQREPTDEQVAWFLEDADAVVDDFEPAPTKWRVRRLPDTNEFDARFRINDITYVLQPGEFEHVTPVRLSTYRSWTRKAS